MSECIFSLLEVKKTAKLVNLPLTESEVSRLSKMFSDTLGYIRILDELDTSKVSETYQVTGLSNVYMDKGDNKATLGVEEALMNANKTERELFVTEGVFNRS